MPLFKISGDASRPQGIGHQIIVHICNDIGAWGSGFVVPLGRRFPMARTQYLAWNAFYKSTSNRIPLGEVQFVSVAENITVANMIGQAGIGYSQGQPPIRYPALKTALATVAKYAQQQKASLHMPRIGAGRAGGDWQIISSMIETAIAPYGLDATVYLFDETTRVPTEPSTPSI